MIITAEYNCLRGYCNAIYLKEFNLKRKVNIYFGIN